MRPSSSFVRAPSRRSVVKLSAVLALAAVVSAIGVLSSPQRLTPGTGRASTSAPLVHNVASVSATGARLKVRLISPALRRSFALLRRRSDSAVAHAAAGSTFAALVPSIVSKWLAPPASTTTAEEGQAPSTILGQASPQNVQILGADGTDVAVLAGTQGVCVAFDASQLLPSARDGYVETCEDARTAAASGVGFAFGSSTGTTRMAGLVPDGNTTVTATFASGATQIVPVLAGVFNVVAPSSTALTSVAYVNGSGTPALMGGPPQRAETPK